MRPSWRQSLAHLWWRQAAKSKCSIVFFYFPSLSITDFFLHSLGSKVYVRPLILALIRHAKFHWLPIPKYRVFRTKLCFSRNILSFATSPFASRAVFLSFRKWRAIRSDCTLPLPWRSIAAICKRGWVAVDSKKTTIFPEHPVPNFATGSPHFKNGPHLAFWLDLYRLLCPSVGMPVRYEN